MENTAEKTVRYLKDLHAAVSGTEKMFQGHADDNDVPNIVRQRCGQYLQQTRDQQKQIQAHLERLGGDSSGFKDFVNNLLSKGSDILNIGHDDEDKLTQDLIKSYGATGILVGAAESLRAYCTTVNDSQTAQFGKQLRDENKEIARGVLDLIGMAAPESAENASDDNATTDRNRFTGESGVNRDLDMNSGLSTETSRTSYAGTDQGAASPSNPNVYRDPSVDPATRILDTNTVPGQVPNTDATNYSGTPGSEPAGSDVRTL